MKAILSLLIIISSYTSFAQFGINTPWTWMKGSNQGRSSGNYGVIGVESPTNEPIARFGASTFKDSDGNLWLFGGMSYLPAPMWWYFDDMWKFNPATNNWTWIKGSINVNQSAVYGTIGVPSITNSPGARMAAASWTDKLGRFWIFGGDAYANPGWTSDLNDLWMFDPATNNWTWMKGNNGGPGIGNYGTIGVPAASNNPSGRYGAASWTDVHGNLWLYGGSMYYPGTFLTDLWKYDIVTNTWTWMKGPVNGGAIYGTQGVGAPSNHPGPRIYSSSWTGQDNKLYLFGGTYYGGSYFYKNDLWEYDPATNEWTWIHGSNSVDDPGSYGNPGVTSSSNLPPSRTSAEGFTDISGNLWLFGGYSWGAFNDLWKYDPAINQWTWMKGDKFMDMPGIYGTQGVPSNNNKPGSRSYLSTWSDNLGNFWLFGGIGLDANGYGGELNDLWKINGLALIPTTLTSFTGRKINDAIQLNWEMQNTIDLQKFYIERSFNQGDFSILDSLTYYPVQSRYQFTDRLTDVNAKDIYYRLKLSGRNGQFSYSNILHFNSSVSIRSIYPNPAKDFINIEMNSPVSPHSNYQIIDALGKIIVQGRIKNIAGNKIMIDVSNLISGSYQVKITSDRWHTIERFVKTK